MENCGCVKLTDYSTFCMCEINLLFVVLYIPPPKKIKNCVSMIMNELSFNGMYMYMIMKITIAWMDVTILMKDKDTCK